MALRIGFVSLLLAVPITGLEEMSSSSLRGKIRKPKDGLVSEQQAENAKMEDLIAEKIWLKLVKAEGSQCRSLKAMLKAYETDKSEWVWAKDVRNPEFPGRMCNAYAIPDPGLKGSIDQGGLGQKSPCPDDKADFPSDSVFIAKYNEMLGANRQKLSKIAARASCDRLVDLLGSPVPVVRNGAVWELVFKKDQEWNTRPDAENMRDTTVVKAYNVVRCNGKSPCDKATADGLLSPMFRFKKGRDGEGNRKLTHRAGIAWTNDDFEGSVVDFWEHNKQHVEFEQSTRACDGSHADRCSLVGKRADFGIDDRARKENCLKWWSDYCQLMTTEYVRAESRYQKSIWNPAKPVLVPDLQNQKLVTNASHVTYHFKQCGVPWVGGVSGSVLEFFAMLEQDEAGQIDDLLILQWMAYYELRGFHSMGEVWTALYAFLRELPYSEDDVKLLTIPPPMTTNGCATAHSNTEKGFLKALGEFVDDYVAVIDAAYEKKHARWMRRGAERAAAAKEAVGPGRAGVVEEADEWDKWVGPDKKKPVTDLADDVEALLQDLGH